MAVHKHSTGGYRAYKKILGVEHQFYSNDKGLADKEQLKFELLSEQAIRIKPRKLFHRNGRMIGFSVSIKTKKENKQNVIARMQVTDANGKRIKKEITHKTIDLTWRWIRREWKDFYDVSTDRRIELNDEIKIAKLLYQVDISKALLLIKNNSKIVTS